MRIGILIVRVLVLMAATAAGFVLAHGLGLHAPSNFFLGGAGFLAILGPDGDIVRVHEADTVSFGTPCVSHALKDAVTRDEPRWIYYDPFDAREYAWLAWEGVPRRTWTLLLAGFAGIDAIPASWGVMF